MLSFVAPPDGEVTLSQTPATPKLSVTTAETFTPRPTSCTGGDAETLEI